MSLRINTNTTSINAHNNLLQTSDALSRSIERLSSGLRINRSADDPAGLVISENLRAQISGITQAMANANDAVNLVKTAEGALSEVHSLLRTMRSLALHAANTGVNDLTAVQADQTQIKSAIESINRIAQQTQFGTKKLLEGSAGVSAVVTDTTNVAGLFIGGALSDGTNTVSGDDLNGDIKLDVTTAATRATHTGDQGYTALTDAVNAAGVVGINGVNVAVGSGDTVQSLLNKINNLTSVTGVTASFDGTNIKLNSVEFGTNAKIEFSDSGGIIDASAGTDSQAGTNAVATLTVNGTAITFNGGQGGDYGLKLRDTNGNVLLLTEVGNSTSVVAQTIGTVKSGSLSFAVGANANQTAQISLGNIVASNLGTTAISGESVASIDVTTGSGANDALKIIDEAISQISGLRANLGAFQKQTLESNIRSLGVAKENLAASESAVRDTDMAAEMVSFTRSQILMQAGTAMLAQANAMPQQVLQLLRG